MSRQPENTALADRVTSAVARPVDALRISEIFFSLQGETSRSGLPTVFIRLTGCPLRCGYCDTAYAFSGGRMQSFAEILSAVAQHRTRYVTVTGGEPLAQKQCIALLRELCDRDYSVSLETSGAIDVAAVDARVSKILDIKTPASGEVEKNLSSNLAHLTPRDEIKFVICDEHDYAWARRQLAERGLDLALIALPYDTDGLEVAEIGAEDMVVCMPAAHPLTAHTTVRESDLADVPLLMLEGGHCLRDHALAACRLSDRAFKEVFQSTSLPTLVAMVAGGVGLTLLPRMAVARELSGRPDLAVRPFGKQQPMRDIALCWRSAAAQGDNFARLAAAWKAANIV